MFVQNVPQPMLKLADIVQVPVRLRISEAEFASPVELRVVFNCTSVGQIWGNFFDEENNVFSVKQKKKKIQNGSRNVRLFDDPPEENNHFHRRQGDDQRV